MEVKVWEASLEDVPTLHIGTCVARALRNKRDDFPLRSSQLLREWDELKEELREQATAHANAEHVLLVAGQGTLGRMSVDEWKARHNLPPEWELGQPYPPESDLYGKEGEALARRQAILRASEPRFPAEKWDSRWYRSAHRREALYD